MSEKTISHHPTPENGSTGLQDAPRGTELALTTPIEALPVARPAQALDAVAILRAAVQGGITEANVAVVERMAALVERQQDRQAEMDSAAALAKLQRETQNVIATKDVDGKFRYAPFLDIWNAVRPAVERYGFTLQWSQEHLGEKIKVTLTLQHSPSGHKRDFTYTMRLGSKADGISAATQLPTLDSITESRAKRRLLMDALNIVVDATAAAEDVGDGSVANQEESDALFRRLVALGGDDASQKRFLALAGVAAWNQIPAAVVPILQRLMTEKEKSSARKGAS